MLAYIKRVLVAFDQLVNVIFGGHPDETISARWERSAGPGGTFIGRVGTLFLSKLQFHHGSKAVEHDRERAALVETIEAKAQGRCECTPQSGWHNDVFCPHYRKRKLPV